MVLKLKIISWDKKWMEKSMADFSALKDFLSTGSSEFFMNNELLIVYKICHYLKDNIGLIFFLQCYGLKNGVDF